MEAKVSTMYLASKNGAEWNQLRKQCQALHLDNIYSRYIERLAVTNVALFLFIIELLLGIHLLILMFLFTYSMWILMTQIMVMILLPLILLICFKNKSKYRHFRLWNNLASCAAVLLLAFRDTILFCLVKTYDTHTSGFYDHIIIVSVYLLLPIAYYGIPCLLGIGVSILYVLYLIVITSTNSQKPQIARHGSYALFLLLLNVLMIAFRTILDYYLRQIVLVRRQLLLQNSLLKRVMQEEEEILQTMLPSQNACLKAEIYKRVAIQNLAKAYLTPLKMHIELHAPVSILSARISNYNELTTSLDVEDILHILLLLVVNFEQAAKSNRVLVIKCLGDAYVFVAGMPKISRTHADSCVALAQAMIYESEKLGEFHKVDIEMRIGIHSGEVFSGLIGLSKWQYDIWSRDVDIAYRLELTGVPGKVHISQITRDFLEIEYPYEEHSSLVYSDPVVGKVNIKTYLIVPPPSQLPSMKSLLTDISEISQPTMTTLSQSSLTEKLETMEQIKNHVLKDMAEKVENMAVGGLQLAQVFDFSKKSKGCNEDYLIRPYITSVWRHFCKWDDELSYRREPDILMKYSMLMVVLICLTILVKHFVPPMSNNVIIMLIISSVLILICILSFYKNFVKKRTPRFFLSRWFLRFSELLDGNFIVRSFVYCLCIILSYIMVALSVVACESPTAENVDAQAQHKLVEVSCLEFWKATHSTVLVFIVIWLTGMPLLFKVVLSAFLFVLHMLTVHPFYFGWHRSSATNMNLPLEKASLWYILSFCLVLFFVDHHITFIKKAIYHYTLLYKKKLLLTENSSRSTKIIMANILPSHALEWFSNRDTHFHERHDKVAIMFASIVDFEPGKTSLRVLHEYICLYDDLLSDYKTNYKVEKIKVSGWTYMAACGLHVDPQVKAAPIRQRRKSIFQIFTSRRKTNWIVPEDMAPTHPLHEPDDHCVMTMTQFAVDLLRIMYDIAIQNEYLRFGGSMRGQLQIGISHGPVVAGIVGKTRPHYDIWGHTVNMASLLTSTGVPGCIHVSENTAIVLRQFDIRCKNRETTSAAESENTEENPTYLVDLDGNLHFQPHDINFSDDDDDILIDFKNNDESPSDDESDANNAATFI